MISRSALVPCAIAALVLYVVAFGILIAGGAGRTWQMVLLAALVLVAATVLMQLTVRRVRADDLLSRTWRLVIPGVVALVGLGLVVYWLAGNPTGGWGLFGLCMHYLGIGQMLSEVRSWDDRPSLRGVRWSAGCAAVYAAGLLLCLLVSAPHGLALAGIALLAAPAGLTLMSEDVLDERLRLRWSGVPLGLVLIGAGALLLALLVGVPSLFVVIGVVALLLLVGAIASNTQADILVLVTAAALVWAATPRPVAESGTVDVSAGEPALVSLGDSYMSGEGAQKFFEGTNRPGVNECRRSPTAYAHRAAADAGEHLAFYACSGAVAAHLHAVARWPGEPVDDGTPDEGMTQLAQLKALLDLTAVDVRLVVVSIGGNDAGFADIGAACLAPGSCVALGQRWLTRLAGVAGKVERAYDAIRRTVGRDVPVLAVPYPQPIREESCPASLLDDDEHQFLAGFVGELNRAVANAARNAGLHYLEGMEGALTGGLRICEGDEDEIGVNFLPLATVDGLTDQVVNPVNWIHNSLHPNERGHAAMAGAFADWRAANPAPDALDPLAAREPFAPAELDEIMSPAPASYCGGPGDDPAFCGRDDEDWALTQIGLLLLYASMPAALVVAGCWLLWLELLPRTRPWWERRLTPGSTACRGGSSPWITASDNEASTDDR